MSKFYVTTPIYYVNDKPHLGHAYTTLCADVLARWHKQRGDEVFFLTGTDEHGAKVQQSAQAAGMQPANFAKQNADKFKEAWKVLGIEYDYFIRTSQPEHEQVVRELLQKVYDAGYIYSGEYEGLYCVGCERFLKPDELVNDRCPLHPNQKPVKQKEKNYFFRLSGNIKGTDTTFAERLLELIDSDGGYKIVPEGRRNEIVGKLKQGLEDISISRESLEWGVRVPWDDTQTVYVWIDALINYYSATQFTEQGKGFWPAQVHLLAKDIVWFHAVIWEALLIAAGLSLPEVIATHGFFTIDGQKMSKSLGNVIDPNDLVKEFGVEATRYLLMSQLPFATDGDVSLARFKERYNSDLANGLGNTFSRLTNMIEKYGIKKPEREVSAASADAVLYDHLENFNFNGVLAVLQGSLAGIAQTIDHSKPWQMFKDGKETEVASILGILWRELLVVAYSLVPFMPTAAKKIISVLEAPKITKAEPLFPRFT